MLAFCVSSRANVEGEKAHFGPWVGTFPKLEDEGSSLGTAQHAAFGRQVGSGTPNTVVVLRDGGP